MAFGPPPSKNFTGKIGTTEDQNWRAYVKAEEIARTQWQTKWGWILNECSHFKKQFDIMSEKYKAAQPQIGKIHPPDPRTIKPIPESTAHEIGWYAGRPEFQLEIYGSDTQHTLPFKKLHS